MVVFKYRIGEGSKSTSRIESIGANKECEASITLPKLLVEARYVEQPVLGRG